MPASARAEMPTPTSTSLNGDSPPRQASAYMSAVAVSAPAKAASGASSGEAPSTNADTPANAAPVVTPMMSGDASALRPKVWKITPDMASAAPASSATRARGRRRSSTITRVASSPNPNSVATTSVRGRPNSP